MSGELRIVEWSVDPDQPLEPAHAFLATGPIDFRGRCQGTRWTVKRLPAVAPVATCSVCREVVAGAAFRALEEIAALEGGPAPITRAGVA
jgi:hypothetical protein